MVFAQTLTRSLHLYLKSFCCSTHQNPLFRPTKKINIYKCANKSTSRKAGTFLFRRFLSFSALLLSPSSWPPARWSAVAPTGEFVRQRLRYPTSRLLPSSSSPANDRLLGGVLATMLLSAAAACLSPPSSLSDVSSFCRSAIDDWGGGGGWSLMSVLGFLSRLSRWESAAAVVQAADRLVVDFRSTWAAAADTWLAVSRVSSGRMPSARPLETPRKSWHLTSGNVRSISTYTN